MGNGVGAEQIKELFLLDPSVTFLNHGSFGACPKPVFSEYQRWQLELERQPVEFLGRRADDLLFKARQRLGSYLNVPADTLVFVTNATAGVNVVIRSLDLEPEDEVLTTDHEYGACTMSWEWLLGKVGARLVKHEIPTPVNDPEELVESILSSVTDRTKAIYLSHITSPTALILPIRQICCRAREMGILTIIDGAHAPGQIALDLEELGADIYTGNLHKWLCAPKGAGFLYVRPEEQAWIESLIVSWGWGRSGTLGESTFVERNQWQGTRDIAAWLAVPAAIEFQEQNDWADVRARCHLLAAEARDRINRLCGITPMSPDSSEWFAQMVSCPVPSTDAKSLQGRLFDDYRVEVPVVDWNNQTLVRTSFQAYNDAEDLDRLMKALEATL
ncbi:aminotransferase class V-fold PLP-dependent enzyme [soil metagenome]